jgi:putative transcriptional regulator
MPASKDNTAVVRSKPDGSFVLVHPDGREEPYRVAEPDWERLDAMTDEELTANALLDPDNPPLTGDELDRMAFAARLKRLRERLGLSQAAFARQFEIPVGNIRDWEQGRSRPETATLAYLRVIEREPEAVKRALAGPA